MSTGCKGMPAVTTSFVHLLNTLSNPPRFRALLFGTPAEETTGGKIDMINAGAFNGVDCALMAHPGGGDAWRAQWLALETVEVEFFGKASHAGGAPWEGINALDAAVMAYNSISSLRQQIHPSCRVHGIIRKGGAAPNIIPDYTKMEYYIRTPALPLLLSLSPRVQACFEGAAAATGCTVKYTRPPTIADVKTNNKLMDRFEHWVEAIENAQPTGATGERAKSNLSEPKGEDVLAGSTDMGNVSWVTPGIHPMYTIYPTASPSNAGIHTKEFRHQAGSEDAHVCAMRVAQALALVGAEFVLDQSLRREVKKEFAGEM
ncbi:hypothetical protein HDV00_001370 [Rhizophlyctis rosea]|nr:hypothetical protein HDV00_001370 [Rhizophlyctis rosea]